MLTPNMAQVWLNKMKEGDVPQRRIKDPWVRAMARDMEGGRWAFTGDPIRFDKLDRLIDGQHRCNAVVASGVTIPVLVIRGLDPSVMSKIDLGVKRTFADYLKIRKFKYADTCSAITSFVHRWINRASPCVAGGSLPISNPERENTFWRFSEPIFQAAEFIHHHDGIRLYVPRSISGFVYFVAANYVDRAKADWFFEHFEEPGDVPRGHPLLALHKALLQHKQERLRIGGGGGSSTIPYVLTVVAWNLYIENRDTPPKGLKVSRNQSGSVQIPEIAGLTKRMPHLQ